MRPAAEADWEFIESLYERPHVQPNVHRPTRDGFVRALAARTLDTLVIERAGKAFGILQLETDPAWLMTVRTLVVEEQRTGGGRYAIEYTLDAAFERRRVDRVFLEVLEANHGARRLYESVGFVQEGLYRNGYRDETGTFHNLVPYGILAGERDPDASPFCTIDHVQLAMPAGGEDLARDFYVGALGMQERPKPLELAARGGAWFRSDLANIHLGVDPDFRPAKKAHPALACRHFDVLIARLKSRGIETIDDEHRYEERRHAYVNDPFGNRLELLDG